MPLDSGPRSKRRLRMWVQMLRATRKAEAHLREYLRVHHASTLPRFDVMSALQRRGEAMTMSELSQMLLVSNGNVTAVVDRLEQDGLVRRTASKADRRSVHVTLTPEGVRQFESLAADHEREVNAWFAGVNDADVETLNAILNRMAKGDHP